MASSSSSPCNWRYNVFTSFHGPDVRKKFLSHLRKQFDENGITMFDDNGIERSQIIARALTKAIKESRIAIVLLSKNYASSSWCLDELLEILKCKEELGQIVMTVFYEVDPSDVRKQRGDFGEAFNKTCDNKEEQRQKWSHALTYVGNIAGEDFKNWPNEAKMIEKIARDVSHKVNDTPCRDFDVMVGLDDHFRKMESLLDLDNVGVKIVGISGPAGIGKSTIARALHSQLSSYHIKKEEKLPSIFTSGNSPLKMALVQEHVTSLADIKGFKTTWRIQVKIIHSWKPYLPATRETIEMILSDNTGTMIHATVKKQQVPKFQRDIVAGQWRFFENFTLSKAVGKFRPTNHPIKMSLMNNTNIRESPMISNDMYFDFVSFEDIVDSNALNENILIDIIGQVVNVGEMETPTVANKPSKKLEVELRDTRDLRLVCTLWGRFADTMYDACQNGGNNMVVCILRFAKINSYLGEKRVSSAYDISVMTINPTYPEAVQFLDNLPKDGLGLTMKVSIPKQIKEQKKEEEFNSLPRTTITELTSSIFEGKFRLLCTIYGIDADWSWYYFCCLKCSKTVYKVPKVENQKVPKDRKPLFWCGTCRKTTSRVQPRYKLIVDVVDPTAQTKLLLFDSHAAKIVMSSSFDLLNGQLDEIEDPTILPQGLVNLKGKTFQFVVSVESDNIGDSNDTYKVGYVWLGIPNEQFDTITESESVTDLTPGVSVDGEALMLTNNTKADEGFGSETKTPSSKRKEESSEDQYDQYSSSKKLCVPSISGAFDKGDLGEGENKSG